LLGVVVGGVVGAVGVVVGVVVAVVEETPGAVGAVARPPPRKGDEVTLGGGNEE